MIRQNCATRCLLLTTLVLAVAGRSEPQREQSPFKLYEAHDLALNEHPQLGQVPNTTDQFCNPKTIQNNLCVVSNQYIRLLTDFYYTTNRSLSFNNTQIQCLSMTNQPCLVFITMQGNGTALTMDNSSAINGRHVVIRAFGSKVYIGTNSTIDVSGSSVNTNGTSVLSPGIGASFIGQGGTCNYTGTFFPTYGEYDMQPDFASPTAVGSQSGSMGDPRNMATAGGGRIVLAVDNLEFAGAGTKIAANGFPLEENRNTDTYTLGGSGGYVYLLTANKNAKNIFGQNPSLSPIQARGGYGKGGAPGGGGGVIVTKNFNISSDLLDASGGLAQQWVGSSCGNGGAGTIYNFETDSLLVDNRDKPTQKFTVVTHDALLFFSGMKIPADWQDRLFDRTLVEELRIKGQANLLIRGEQDHMAFHTLEMTNRTSLVLAHNLVGNLTSNVTKILINLKQTASIASTALLDFSRVDFVILNATDADPTANSTLILGQVLYRIQLGVIADQVTLNGDIGVPRTLTQYQKERTQLLITSSILEIAPNVSVRSGSLLLLSRSTLVTNFGTVIESYKQNTCNKLVTSADLFDCVPKEQLSVELTTKSFMNAFNTQFNLNYSQLGEMAPTLMSNFTVYLVAFESLEISKSKILGSRIGFCAANLSLFSSTVNTTGRGCLPDNGLGAGKQNLNCGAGGGAYGGNGGSGSQNTTDPKKIQDCAANFARPYYFSEEARYEGSGGGSANVTAATGGTGGGIVWISSSNTVELKNSTILADGTAGMAGLFKVGSGGGSGGSVQMTMGVLKGDGVISIAGGEGSNQGGGGGSGGRLVTHFLHGFSAKVYPEMSYNWAGNVNLSGGVGGKYEGAYTSIGGSGQNGTSLYSRCHGGFSGPFCRPCDPGFYKLDFTYGECQPCQNKPSDAFYIGKASATAKCPYECNYGLDSAEVNPLCQNIIELQITKVGGTISALGVIFLFFFFCLSLWACLINRSKQTLQKTSEHNSTLYDGVLFSSDSELDSKSESIVGSRNLKINDSDIWSHAHRMYFIGDNSISFPWFVPKDFPARSLDPSNKDKLLAFIKHKQNVLDWTESEKNLYLLSRLLFAPLSGWVHSFFRQRHFIGLQDEIFLGFDPSFWDERQQRTFRVSTSTRDLQLGYVDFLNYNKQKADFLGPQLPLTLVLGGNGTYDSPYALDFESDPLAKSVVYLQKNLLKSKLPTFFENLNTLLSKLSFYKLTTQCLKDFSEVIEFVEIANKALFNPLNVKASLYIFENSYQEVDRGTFKQRRRSLPLEPLVFEAVPEMLRSLVRFVRSKLLAKKSEIRMALVFKPFSARQRQKLDDRVRYILRLRSQNPNGRDFGFTQVFVSDDEDEENQAVPDLLQEEGRYSNLGKLIRQGLSQDESLLSESHMEESVVHIYGHPQLDQAVKIVDKSKRAFSISLDSTKAFELSLQKPRDSWKHKFTRFRALIYSLWILLFKHHGRPPVHTDLYGGFLCFASLIALDLVLLLVMVLHITGPWTNMSNFGAAFLFIYPGIAVIAPLLGVWICISGDAEYFRMYSSMNASLVLVNYPLTLIVQWCVDDAVSYMALVVLLWFNKIGLSYFGGKVRQFLLNPGYTKNLQKLESKLQNVENVTAVRKTSADSERLSEEEDQKYDRTSRIAALVASDPSMPGEDETQNLDILQEARDE